MKKDISPARRRLYAIIIIILILFLLAVKDSNKRRPAFEFYDDIPAYYAE